MMDTMRISVDFNTMQMDPKRRVYIGRKDSELDDQALIRALVQGVSIVLYDEVMQVHAIAEFDNKDKVWFGAPDWSTREVFYPQSAVAQ